MGEIFQELKRRNIFRVRYPEDAHLSAVSNALMIVIRGAISDWFKWAEDVFDTWDDNQSLEEKEDWAIEVYRSFSRHFEEMTELRKGERNSVRAIRLEDLPKFPLK